MYAYINQHCTLVLLCASICLYSKYSVGFTVAVPMEEPKYAFNPLSANPTKWSNTNNLYATADNLFECI